MSGGFVLRPLRASDAPQVTACWSRCFGDPPETVSRALAAGKLLSHGIAAEAEGAVRSFMFAFDGLFAGEAPAAYLYALCTQPEYRGRGMAAAVLKALTEDCFCRGAEFVFLAPADQSLAAWYRNRFGMVPLSGTENVEFPLSPHAEGICTRISAEEYLSGREGSPFRVSPGLLRTQESLCGTGGFFRTAFPGGEALACVCAEGGTLSVRELLCPDGTEQAAVGALAVHLGGRRIFLRRPGTQFPLLGLSNSALQGMRIPAFFFPFSMD